MVAGRAFGAMADKWDAKYVKPAALALGHDDEYVRVKALRALLANVDRSFDKDLKALLQDTDLRKQGMSGYLAVKPWGEGGIEAVQPWLSEDAQLLRYDALSALLQYGGEECRKLVREQQGREMHPWFTKWLEAVGERK
jgi:hypothetical protein